MACCSPHRQRKVEPFSIGNLVLAFRHGWTNAGFRFFLNVRHEGLIFRHAGSQHLVLGARWSRFFMRWISTSGGLGEFIQEFAGLRGSILMSHREMLVHHNEAEEFSYAVAAGIPLFA